MAQRTRRVTQEIAEIRKMTGDKYNVLEIELPNENDMTHLKGIFYGPEGTPYEGGRYVIDIQIPNEYPFKPPKMKFDTRIYHPNISSQTGAICLDTIGQAWSPILTLKSTLQSLQSLLSTPEPKDPQDAQVAQKLMTKPKEFEAIAREWAVKFANAPNRERGEGSGGATAESLRRKQQMAKEQQKKNEMAAYRGYNKRMVDGFVEMGFDIGAVVDAFEFVGIDRNGGQWYEMEQEYMGDVTSRLFGEE